MKDYGVSTWTGKSGKKYEFETYSLDTEFNPGIEGNYIFAKPGGTRRYMRYILVKVY